MIDPETCKTCKWAGKVSGAYITYCDYLHRAGKIRPKGEGKECPVYEEKKGRRRVKNMDYIFGRKNDERSDK